MPPKPQNARLNSLKLLLRPVVAYCLSQSQAVQELTEALKFALIEGAVSEMQARGEKVNISRLSVMTGLHRRDVMRIYRGGEAKDSSVNLISKVIGQWENDRRFQNKSGKPRRLKYVGDDSEFSRLVRTVSHDVHPGTVLFELERGNLVKKDETTLSLLRAFEVTKGDMDKTFKVLTQDVTDLVCAVQENIKPDCDVPNLHARTEYDNVVKSALPKIREWFLKEGAAFHKKARDFLSQFDRDMNPSLTEEKAGSRVSVGTFSRIEINDEEE